MPVPGAKATSVEVPVEIAALNEILPVPLDYPRALSNCNDDHAFLRELATDFSSEAHDELEKMRQALGLRDARCIAKAAHNLKGAAACLCAEPLYSGAEELEQLAGNDILEAAGAQIEMLDREVERCVAYLQQNSCALKMPAGMADADPEQPRRDTIRNSLESPKS
jgi:HPt (histidine-containing phosphotransfer) domain-containing protein